MPKNLASADEWKKLEQEINTRFKLNAAVFDAEGVRVTDFANWGNKLCPVIKGNPTSLSAICAVANKSFLSRAKEAGDQAIVDCCDAGLIKLCVPIRADGKFVGFAGGCGCLPENEELESFLVSKTTGMSEDEVAELRKSIPTLTKQEAEEAVEFIRRRLAEILSKS